MELFGASLFRHETFLIGAENGQSTPGRHTSILYRESIRLRQLTINNAFAILTASVALASCGGGGGSSSSAPPPPPPPPDLGTAEGLWNGTTGSGRVFSGLVLDDGTYWFLYSAVGNNAVLAVWSRAMARLAAVNSLHPTGWISISKGSVSMPSH